MGAGQHLDGDYLIQAKIEQHAAMSALHPHSLNTLRVITFYHRGSIHVFSAAQRIGTNGRMVDNWTAGGILVGVELETGKLRADGFYKPGYGERVFHHPQTGVPFLGFEIPYFRQAVELAKKLHSFLNGIHSIGWDIAIGVTGPVIIEGNDDWDGAVPMALESDFRKRLMQMYEL